MAIIQFEDGTKVNFNGTPTAKDVEEVASQLQLKPKKKGPGFIQSVAQGIVKTPARFATTVGQIGAGIGALGAYGVNKALGRQESAKRALDFGNAVTSPQSIDAGYFGKINTFTGRPTEIIGAGAELATLGMGGGAVKSGVKTLGQKPLGQLIKFGAKYGAGIGGVEGAGVALQNEKPTVGGVVSGALGGATAGALLGGVAPIIARRFTSGGKAAIQSEKEAKNFTKAVQALDPEMKKKEIIQAYAQGRGEKKFGVFQTLKESNEATRLASELSDVIKSKDPLKNLSALDDAFTKVERELDNLLVTDKTPVIKESVMDVLDEAKLQIPRGYRGIRDTEATFIKVLDFAKEKIGRSEPTVNGLRQARKAFDQQAKKEFTTAFKGGNIELAKVSDRAIKLGRDIINDYLYKTAKQGSRAQALIKKEANIFRARDIIAEKAASLHKKGPIARFVKKHPYVTGGASAVVGGASAAATMGYLFNRR